MTDDPRYDEARLFRLAKRHHNTKRPYLLVNPLLGKHLPVSPTESLSMMYPLGNLLRLKYPDVKLIIGFAETATAVGAEVAACFKESAYIHTTRENIANVRQWIPFSEEHSHAVEQRLCGDSFSSLLDKTQSVVFVDDELTTGKTIANIVSQLRDDFPSFQKKRIIAASLISRINSENRRVLSNIGVTCESLLQLPEVDYSPQVALMETTPPQELTNNDVLENTFMEFVPSNGFLDPRRGVSSVEYIENCRQIAGEVINRLGKSFGDEGKILVLGTEEWMYPGLILGEAIEKIRPNAQVRFHATTRSPVEILDREDYPIRSGCQIPSFYDDFRKTFVYNLSQYDAAIVVSDTCRASRRAMNVLAALLKQRGCQSIFYVHGDFDVQHLS